MDALTVEKLAEVLQEPNRPLLTQVLRTLGTDRTTAILTDALTCEANGGMLTKDGTRRRTPGGVFFQLVRQQASPHERRRLFPRPVPQHGQEQSKAPTALTWGEVQIITKSAEKPRHSCRGWIGVGRAGLNAQEPNKTYAVPEPSMGEGTA